MSRCATSLLALVVLCAACGPVPPPDNAFTDGDSLLAALAARRAEVRSFRAAGKVDHFGEEHRVQGKIYAFGELPNRLRVDLLSPFGSALNVLTVDGERFALSDVRQGTFLHGPAEPCNIARLVRIPLPPEDVIRVLVGHTPILEGAAVVTWDRQEGHYVVELRDGPLVQRLEVGPGDSLPLRRSHLADGEGTVFDIRYDRWRRVADGVHVPHEIRVKMPREKADLAVLYDDDGVEVNVELPGDSWTQEPAPGFNVQEVRCR